MTPEMRKAFHEELDELEAEVIRLADMAITAIDRGTNALLAGDLEEAEATIADDQQMDQLTWWIDDRALELLARQQPMAGDLRTLVTIMRVIHEIERTGDYITNICKATRRLFPYALDPEVRALVEKMRKQAILQMKTASEAFAERNVAKADALADMDDVMDELQKDLFRWIFVSHTEDDEVQRAVQIGLVGRYYERMADHAVNFGERVAFMVTGAMTEVSADS